MKNDNEKEKNHEKVLGILLAMMLVLSMVTVAGATEVGKSVYGRGRLYDYGKPEGRCGSRIPSVPDFHC